MRVYLIGFMGCGKTTLGKMIARELNCDFIDMDAWIEGQMGITIHEIFQEKGEFDFREMERNALHSISQMKSIVVSTGGGVPCFYDNLEYMNTHGVTVYLKMSVHDLVQRLNAMSGFNNGNASRPLIAGKNEKELLEFVAENLEKREKWYNQAFIIAEGPDFDINAIVEEIKSNTYNFN
jgi:shikimate kinase